MSSAGMSMMAMTVSADTNGCVGGPMTCNTGMSMMMKDDVSSYEFDDSFAHSELIYGILVNK